MANSKKILYVGGLAEEVDVNMLKSAFLPFGDIIDVNLPMDYSKNQHKGFAFIEFQLPEDAADAIDNMDNGELLGRTIRVNLAKPNKFRAGNTKPIWADDEYLQKIQADEGAKEHPEGVDDETGNVKVSSDSDSD